MKTLRLLALGLVSLAAIAAASAGQVAEATKDKLVHIADGKLVAVPDGLAGKSIVAVYYSAHWCPPCRAFTPQLVAFYNEVKAKHPGFELVFVSSDKTADAMKEYMVGAKMPWLALAFEHRGLSVLGQHKARGIPYLIVLDANDKVLLAKAADQDWRPPQEVLQELKTLLAKQP